MLVTAARLDGSRCWGRQVTCTDSASNALTTKGRPGLLGRDGGTMLAVTEQPASPGLFAEASAPLQRWIIT